jgi:hypothetical protein
MQTPEKILASAARKIAKWYRAECSYQLLHNGFILKMNGDSRLLPTIGVVGDQLIGSQDDFDAFLDLLGYEAQVERVLFDPSKVKYVLDAGWCFKVWTKPTERQVLGQEELEILANTNRCRGKVGAISLALMLAVRHEGRRRIGRAAFGLFRKKR